MNPSPRTPRFACLAACCAAAIGLGAAPGSANARSTSLRTGLTDITYQLPGPGRVTALRRTADAKASVVRVVFSWSTIARVRPPSSEAARDPGWPGYDWTEVDESVRAVAAAGLTPLVTFAQAPAWAEGPGRPSPSRDTPEGTWLPSPTAFGEFAQAAARRYSGSFADPARPGARLPRVRYLQAWSEPNTPSYLSPQWSRRRGRLVPMSPAHYRLLLNAFYSGVKAVRRDVRVISAGTGSFGDPIAGGRRVPPARFVRDLLCVRGRRRPRPFRCTGSPVRFDVLAHHPYSVGGPTRRALNRDDATLPDLRKLLRPLAAARRYGTVRPRSRKPIWITEFSWDSRPPDPDGVPTLRHARWLEGGLYVLWRQGARVVTWFRLRDEGRGRGFPFTIQSGLYLSGNTVEEDRPKPALTAFRFPFTAYRNRRGAHLWGLAPGSGPVTVEIRRRSRWVRLTRLAPRRSRLFQRRMRVRRGSLLRARQGGETSITWPVR